MWHSWEKPGGGDNLAGVQGPPTHGGHEHTGRHFLLVLQSPDAGGTLSGSLVFLARGGVSARLYSTAPRDCPSLLGIPHPRDGPTLPQEEHREETPGGECVPTQSPPPPGPAPQPAACTCVSVSSLRCRHRGAWRRRGGAGEPQGGQAGLERAHGGETTSTISSKEVTSHLLGAQGPADLTSYAGVHPSATPHALKPLP